MLPRFHIKNLLPFSISLFLAREKRMGSQVQNNFGDFFEQWMSQLEEYVQLLVHARRESSQEDHHEENLKALVDRLTQHHKDYYTAKWEGIQEDVFVFFFPSLVDSTSEGLFVDYWMEAIGHFQPCCCPPRRNNRNEPDRFDPPTTAFGRKLEGQDPSGGGQCGEGNGKAAIVRGRTENGEAGDAGDRNKEQGAPAVASRGWDGGGCLERADVRDGNGGANGGLCEAEHVERDSGCVEPNAECGLLFCFFNASHRDEEIGEEKGKFGL